MDASTACAFFREAMPARVHFLGLGPLSDRFPALRAALLRTCPGATLSCDSVVITAQVGHDREQARPLTHALHTIQTELEDGAWHAPGNLDYTDHIGDPSAWLVPAKAKALATRLSMTVDEVMTPDFARPDLEHALDMAWHEYALGQGTGIYRKRESIRRLCAAWKGTRP
jgi:hypothetical protein